MDTKELHCPVFCLSLKAKGSNWRKLTLPVPPSPLVLQLEERRKTEMEAAHIETVIQAARRAAAEYCEEKTTK